MVEVNEVERACDDLHVGVVLTHLLGRAHARHHVGERQNENLRVRDSGRLEECELRGVAVVGLESERAQPLEQIRAEVDDRRWNLMRVQEARRDLTDAPQARDDDRIVLVVDGVVFASAPVFQVGISADDPLMEDEEERRRGHGQRDDERQFGCLGGTERTNAQGGREQDEGELTSLRQQNGEQRGILGFHAEQARAQEQHGNLGAEQESDSAGDESRPRGEQ